MRWMLTTLLAAGSLVFVSAPAFACGDEEGEEDPEDPSVLSLTADTQCGDEEEEEDPEDPSVLTADTQCGDEEEEEDPEDPSVR
ncbi:MAG: hypothetical protein RJA70_69 [Pseudomonadota bacterium]